MQALNTVMQPPRPAVGLCNKHASPDKSLPLLSSPLIKGFPASVRRKREAFGQNHHRKSGPIYVIGYISTVTSEQLVKTKNIQLQQIALMPYQPHKAVKKAT